MLKSLLKTLMTRRLYPLGLSLSLGVLSICGHLGGNGFAVPAAATQDTITISNPERISYGHEDECEDECENLQFGDLRLPSGPGLYPVAVVIHGGCWSNLFGLDLMDDMSDALTEAGIATWNIEYRRTGDPGGGYPNTLIDVGMAVDKLRDLAPIKNLNLDRVITVGHSAGGHLGVWVGARLLLPVGHPLRGPDPLPLHASVALAGIMNLAEYLNINDCGKFVDDFMGGTPAEVPERYALASPSELLPIGLDTTLVQGTLDDIVPPELAEHYRADAKDTGDHHVNLKKIHDANHFDVITPTSPAWPKVQKAILKALD
jgi:acetyl esterase/lipase